MKFSIEQQNVGAVLCAKFPPISERVGYGTPKI